MIVQTQWLQTYPLVNDMENDAYNRLIADLEQRPIEMINRPFVQSIFKNELYFPNNSFQTGIEARRKPHLKALFTATVMQYRFLKDPNSWQDLVEISDFPNQTGLFDHICMNEYQLLCRYWIACRELLKVLPGRQNQGLFLAVGALLEYSGVIYKTGGAPSDATSRRLAIYRHLSSVTPTNKKKSKPTDTVGAHPTEDCSEASSLSVASYGINALTDGSSLVSDGVPFSPASAEEEGSWSPPVSLSDFSVQSSPTPYFGDFQAIGMPNIGITVYDEEDTDDEALGGFVDLLIVSNCSVKNNNSSWWWEEH